MRISLQLRYLSQFSSVALWSSILGLVPVGLLETRAESTSAQAAITEQLFQTSDEAVQALRSAAAAKDLTALNKIFGTEFSELLTGDKVQDANNAQTFATMMAQGCSPVNERDDKITLEIGTNNWPMPIPLVKKDGNWHFDTSAGKDEVISRHIGKDELHAIGVCRAYVTAQKQYASLNHGTAGEPIYAGKFKSSTGKKDGLYWPASESETASPFGPLVAEAHAEGYGKSHGSGPHPFHGYYFRILTRQGSSAPGGRMNYERHGNLTLGFALVAYPVRWDQSGIMTFVVNQDGKVYQNNLGENTPRVAGSMKEYNPDNGWTLVPDEGVVSAASEK